MTAVAGDIDVTIAAMLKYWSVQATGRRSWCSTQPEVQRGLKAFQPSDHIYRDITKPDGGPPTTSRQATDPAARS